MNILDVFKRGNKMADNTAIQNFKNAWLGRRIDYDHVYAYQCVDLILQYLKEVYGLPSGVSGNAIDYWTRPSQPLLARFDKVPFTGANLIAGDIIVLNGVAGNPYGHIGIAYNQDNQTITILEQNGSTGNGSGQGGDSIRLRAVQKNRVAGILRQKAAVPPKTQQGGTARVLRDCNVRVAPNTGAALGGSRYLVPGDTFQYTEKVAGQAVGSNNIWYRSTKGNYVWSGNCQG